MRSAGLASEVGVVPDLDPKMKDAWGLPAPRLTFTGHPNDFKLGAWFGKRGEELLDAAGALSIAGDYGGPDGGGPHLLGTCRMGSDPRTSVVNGNTAEGTPSTV